MTEADEIPPGLGKRVLLVDDEETVINITSRRLEFLGYDVTSETSPIAALERIRQAPNAFDVLVTDYTMPGMNGLELIRAVEDINATLPAVMVSGNRIWSARDELARGSLKRVLAKPVELREFGVALREVIDAAM